MIQFHQISKNYQRGDQIIRALEPVTLNVAAGEFVALIGRSGSGKSTLLSILGGMLSPTTGRVLLDGHSMFEMGPAQRARLRNQKIGFVFQNFNLIPWMTALENVELPLSLYNRDRAGQRHLALELLGRFGLSDRVGHKPSELSAGQQQRVALARTLAMNPLVILADEPTGNLDAESRDMVLDTLIELRKSGQTVILVTHDPAVSSKADRVFHMAEGIVSEPQAA